ADYLAMALNFPIREFYCDFSIQDYTLLAKTITEAWGPMIPQLPQPYLLFLGDATAAASAKTAFGLRDWAPERCIGEWGCDSATVTLGLTRLSPKEAYARGARGLVIGIANEGGFIAKPWIPLLVEALESGLDIISGMHAKLQDIELLRDTAARLGRALINIRI